MKLQLTIFAVLIVVTGQVFAQIPAQPRLGGTYRNKMGKQLFQDQYLLTLRPDSSFTYVYFNPCIGRDSSFGHWHLEGQTISLTTDEALKRLLKEKPCMVKDEKGWYSRRKDAACIKDVNGKTVRLQDSVLVWQMPDASFVVELYKD